MSEVLYSIKFHFENVPDFLRDKMEEKFRKNYYKAVDVFNEKIDEINEEWDKAADQSYTNGIYVNPPKGFNPNYDEYVIEQMQPYLDELNKNFHFCKFKLDEHCDIVGYLPFIEDSKLWIELI